MLRDDGEDRLADSVWLGYGYGGVEGETGPGEQGLRADVHPRKWSTAGHSIDFRVY